MHARIHAGDEVKLPLKPFHLPDAKADEKKKESGPQNSHETKEKTGAFPYNLSICFAGEGHVVSLGAGSIDNAAFLTPDNTL
ncbi:hypothetical protein BCBD1442_26740 [Brucella ceti]|nr:hypothetical protein BCBD1442_26740 [Brucella ceti]